MAAKHENAGRLVVTEDLYRRISLALLALFGIPILLLLISEVHANGEDCGSILSFNDRLFSSAATERACADAVSGRGNTVIVLGAVGVAALIARSVLLDVAPSPTRRDISSGEEPAPDDS